MDTTSPFTLSDEQFNNLLHLSQLYRRQALRCLDAKAYVAGSVMVGAALELMEPLFEFCIRRGEIFPPLSSELETKLRERFRPEVEHLEKLLGRDLWSGGHNLDC